MSLNDCIKFANENPVCFLATCDGDQPRVRCMGFWFADETGFYFQTGEIKEMVGQMRRNKKIEVCFIKAVRMQGKQYALRGRLNFSMIST
ncbi:MAG: pyridoxamine 5'-phosphate oxidase family protein [Chitinivibrionales bacterium]|nr:pyridoxamine 5'-phosphate oxidase family protein [Chitinivibrionales bacterium]